MRPTNAFNKTKMLSIALLAVVIREVTALDQTLFDMPLTHDTTYGIVGGAIQGGGDGGSRNASTVTTTLTASSAAPTAAANGCPWAVEEMIGTDEHGRFFRYPTGLNLKLLEEHELGCIAVFKQAMKIAYGEEDWFKEMEEEERKLVEEERKLKEQLVEEGKKLKEQLDELDSELEKIAEKLRSAQII